MEEHKLYNEQSLETRVKELTDENTLLFDQLHVVQEELERYYNTNKDYERKIKSLTEDNAKLIEQGKQSSVKSNGKSEAKLLEENKKLIEKSKEFEQRVRKLTEENTRLFEQLQVVQESLEKYADQIKLYEETKGKLQESSNKSQRTYATKQMVSSLIEAERLRVLTDQQKIAYDVERKNSRSSRLGNMVLESSVLTVPTRLLGTWRSWEKTTPPSSLGGKTFQKLIDLYLAKGEDAVEQLLDKAAVSFIVRANAYTALARHLSKKDPEKTAAFARLAWETDPQPYRMKWLAHRVYEAGDAATAEALLEMLPSDLSRSPSEERQEECIRLDAAQERERLVQQRVDVAESQRLDAQKLERVTKEAESRRKELDALKKQLDQSTKDGESRRKELDALKKQLEQSTEDGESRRKELDTLKKQLEQSSQESEDIKKEVDTLNKRLEQAAQESEAWQREEKNLQAALDAEKQLVKASEEQAMMALNAQMLEAQKLVEKHRQDMAAADELLAESQALADERQRENLRLQKELADTRQLVRSRGLALDSLHAQQQGADSRNQAWLQPQGMPPLDARSAQENFHLQQAQNEAMQRAYQHTLLQLNQQLAEIQRNTLASPGYSAGRFPQGDMSYFDARLREVQGLATEWQRESYRLQMQNETMQKVYQDALVQVIQQLAAAKSLTK